MQRLWHRKRGIEVVFCPSHEVRLYFIKKVEKDFFRAYHNLDSGDKTLGENLKIKILSFKEVKKINTSSAIIGLKLLENKFLNFK